MGSKREKTTFKKIQIIVLKKEGKKGRGKNLTKD
jgi:hypothetical protein